jgi:hypothetical protein
VASGEAAIRVAEKMHSLLRWLESIVVQYLHGGKLHVAI